MNNTFYASNDYRVYLAHHGIKGMKWGVRRYRNYDGSYTQAGIKRYNITEKRYDDADAKFKQAKSAYKAGRVSKQEYRSAKQVRKEALHDLKSDYKRLKTDKLADEGKKLYAEGKTITGNSQTASYLSIGAVAAGSIAEATGDVKIAAITYAAGSAAILGKRIADEYVNKRLRAYYAHGGNWAGWDKKNAEYIRQYGPSKIKTRSADSPKPTSVPKAKTTPKYTQEQAINKAYKDLEKKYPNFNSLPQDTQDLMWMNYMNDSGLYKYV